MQYILTQEEFDTLKNKDDKRLISLIEILETINKLELSSDVSNMISELMCHYVSYDRQTKKCYVSPGIHTLI